MDAPSAPPPETLPPPALPWWQRWRSTLLAVFTLVALAVGAVEIARTVAAYRRAEQAALALLSDAAAALATTTELYVARYTAIAETAAEAIFRAPAPLTPEARRALLAGIRRTHPETGLIGVIDPAGRVIDALPIAGIGLDVSDRDYFRRAAAGAPAVASDLLAGRLTGDLGTPVVVAARNEDGSLAGMVLVGLPVHGLARLLRGRLEDTARALVVDRTGRAIVDGAHPDLAWEARDYSRVPLVAAALAGRPVRLARFPSPHTGEPALGAMVPVPALGWAVGVVQPVEAALAPARQQLRLSLAIAGAVLVLGIVLARLLSTWLSRPIADLAAGAAAIARGDLGRRVVPRGPGELRWLAEHFNRMAARLGEIGRLNEQLVATALRERQSAQERAEEAEAAKRRFAFLAEASTRLAASLDYESTLANVARLAVPDLADYCVVDLLEPDRSTRRLAVAHRDPARAALANELYRFPPDLDGTHPVARVMRSGRPELSPEITAEMLVGIASTPEHLRILQALEPKSDMRVPLVARGRTLGAITFVSAESGRRYGPADLALAEELARRAALAIDNARLYRQAQTTEQRFRDLVEGLEAIVWEADARSWLFTFVNRRAERMLGYPLERWLTEPDFWVNLIHPEDRERAVACCLEAIRQGCDNDFEYRVVAADGRVVWVRDLVYLVKDGSGAVRQLRGLMIDITAQKEAADELRGRARQQAAVAALGQRALEGVEPSVLLDEAVGLVARTLDVEYAAVLELLADGGRFLVRAGAGWEEGVVGRLIVDAGAQSQAGYCLLTREPVIVEDWTAEQRFARPPGLAAHGVLSGMAVVIRGANGPYGVLAAHATRPRRFTLNDSHFLQAVANVLAAAIQRQRAEEALRRSEEQLRQAQKMEAVGRLAGGIAHDFNNILTAIAGYSELLLGRIGEAGQLRKDVEGIRKAAERAAALTRQLLAFSRRQVLQPKVLDLNAVVAGMAPMLRRLIGENIELITVTAERPGLVKADPGLLEQVILNLAVNARDAMPQGGTLRIETAHADPADADAPRAGADCAGPCVVLAVSDTGCGMDAEVRSHLFEPFFTTKEVGQGTGLGLSTVYGIVEQSGGRIRVTSEVGRGSTFRIYFPGVAEPDAAPAPAEAPAGPAAGAETVLLVEDDEIVRALAREALERAGYTVLEARDGREALAIAERHRGPIHLLLTDVVMPGMSGPEVAGRLTAARAGLKVLFMSGYTDNAIGQRGVLDPGTALLPKPFTPAQLTRKLREVLDAPGPRA